MADWAAQVEDDIAQGSYVREGLDGSIEAVRVQIVKFIPGSGYHTDKPTDLLLWMIKQFAPALGSQYPSNEDPPSSDVGRWCYHTRCVSRQATALSASTFRIESRYTVQEPGTFNLQHIPEISTSVTSVQTNKDADGTDIVLEPTGTPAKPKQPGLITKYVPTVTVRTLVEVSTKPPTVFSEEWLCKTNSDAWGAFSVNALLIVRTESRMLTYLGSPTSGTATEPAWAHTVEMQTKPGPIDDENTWLGTVVYKDPSTNRIVPEPAVADGTLLEDIEIYDSVSFSDIEIPAWGTI